MSLMGFCFGLYEIKPFGTGLRGEVGDVVLGDICE